MATLTHYLQGTTPTEIESTDTLWFAGGTFSTKITVDEYNSSTHVKASDDTDKSAGNTPRNVKYISSTTADWGDGTENLTDILDAECTLKIVLSSGDGDIATENGIFYAYDGTTKTNPPAGMTFYAAEKGNSTWTACGGSGNALSLADQSTPAATHNFYIAVSAKPTSVGAKSGKYWFETDYY